MKKHNLVFTGGGTAGHIMPCVALIDSLKNDYNIHYIGSKNGMEKHIVSSIASVTYHEIECVRFVRGINLKNFLIPFKLVRGRLQARKLLKRIKPKAVFSKGGYVALPVALSAKCPLICHESDRSLGLSNKLVRKKARYFCCAYEETAKKYPKNGLHTGIPIRRSLFLSKKPVINGAKPRLLIIGGSLGSKVINDCINSCLDELIKNYDITHITGRGKACQNLDKKGYRQVEFCDDMGKMYQNADIVISRGGATVLFELIALKLPSLIIPLAKGASRGDQVENADYFQSKGLCHVLYESNLTPKTLVESLNNCFFDKELRKNLDKTVNIDATAAITSLIRSIT